MQQVFSPKQVALAIGASESSVKRWCDSGVISSVKTAGGHRRVPISGILAFVRSDNRALIVPEAIGLPAKVSNNSVKSLGISKTEFKRLLVEDNFEGCRRILFELYLSGHSLAVIFDQVIANSMHELGDDWCDGTVQIFEERRSCELAYRLMCDIRATCPLPKSSAPIAMGGSAEHDPYDMPTRMVELVLVELGWNATSLGGGIPISSFVNAIESQKPRLFWLSVSSMNDESRFLADFAELAAVCGTSTALVVGGRGLTETLRREMQYSAYCENLQRLAAFAQALYENKKES